MRRCWVDTKGRPIDVQTVIGSGVDGIILKQSDNSVLKIPKLYGTIHDDDRVTPDEDNDSLTSGLENEKDAYERLRYCNGIALCRGISDDGIILQYYAPGNLSDFIRQNNAVSVHMRRQWIMTIAEAIAACHEAHVLVFDVALRNIVLTPDLEPRLIDFTNSAVVPVETDLSAVDDEGASIRLDILHFGSVLYSISAWQHFSVDCDSQFDWPDRSQLPSTRHIAYGSVIENCWGGQHVKISDVRFDLKRPARKRRQGRKR